jgi:O-antigen/teichoic acid export membrane protein
MVNVVLDIMFIPLLGILGAAIATSTALFVSSFGSLIVINKHLGIRRLIPIAFLPSGIIAGIIVVGSSSIYIRLFSLLILTTLLFYIAWTAKVFKSEDTKILEKIDLPSSIKKILQNLITLLEKKEYIR